MDTVIADFIGSTRRQSLLESIDAFNANKALQVESILNLLKELNEDIELDPGVETEFKQKLQSALDAFCNSEDYTEFPDKENTLKDIDVNDTNKFEFVSLDSHKLTMILRAVLATPDDINPKFQVLHDAVNGDHTASEEETAFVNRLGDLLTEFKTTANKFESAIQFYTNSAPARKSKQKQLEAMIRDLHELITRFKDILHKELTSRKTSSAQNRFLADLLNNTNTGAHAYFFGTEQFLQLNSDLRSVGSWIVRGKPYSPEEQNAVGLFYDNFEAYEKSPNNIALDGRGQIIPNWTLANLNDRLLRGETVYLCINYTSTMQSILAPDVKTVTPAYPFNFNAPHTSPVDTVLQRMDQADFQVLINTIQSLQLPFGDTKSLATYEDLFFSV